MPGWVKELLDDWLRAANLKPRKMFRRVNKNGKACGDGLTEKAVWHVVREYARKAGASRPPKLCRIPDYAESKCDAMVAGLRNGR